ncbi:hypothetical protein ERJ75_000378600 [Trypanosoma vivax]|uniref:Uncharacterized protein n=1 Tax=Trypanosoma vivax (strain Y486) TaxID=1055687 RepID=G0TRU3_TRYVY|nr:hypothetical protein ERJ75_000378600 [Trypanosoma vivax]CCC46665.1 conserved hypothetical protein [Trypanosoma vivax Y486]
MVSRDSRYVHRCWHLEDATLTIEQPTLELLVGFDEAANFHYPSNAPLTLGMRRAAAPSADSGGALDPTFAEELLNDWREIGIPPFTEE